MFFIARDEPGEGAVSWVVCVCVLRVSSALGHWGFCFPHLPAFAVHQEAKQTQQGGFGDAVCLWDREGQVSCWV